MEEAPLADRVDVMLDLEVAGPIRELEVAEQPGPAPKLKRLSHSHHAVARLVARGLRPQQVSLQTGYTVNRIDCLLKDASFQELVTAYTRENAEIATEVEQRFLLIAEDAAQRVHEMILDEKDVPLPQLLETLRTFADRAGYAPVQRTVNRNLNLNIGDRLDEARRRREIPG